MMMMINYTNSYDNDGGDKLYQQSGSLTCLCSVVVMVMMMMYYTIRNDSGDGDELHQQTFWPASVL